MTDVFTPDQTAAAAQVPEQTLAGFIGKRLVYRYASGGLYELYVKNATTIDYRMHEGPGANRWVRDQPALLARLSGDAYRVTWTEPTGTAVSTVVDLAAATVHGVAFFPWWLIQDLSQAEHFQNDHLDSTAELREKGPTYPLFTVHEFAVIVAVEDVGPDDESAVDCSPAQFRERRPDLFTGTRP